jgi:hypothetical protein
MQGASALGAEIVDQDAICDRQAHAFRERMLVEIGRSRRTFAAVCVWRNLARCVCMRVAL